MQPTNKRATLGLTTAAQATALDALARIAPLVRELRLLQSMEVLQQAATLLNIANEFLRYGDAATAIEFCHFALEKTNGDPGQDQHIFLELAQAYSAMKESSRAEEALRRGNTSEGIEWISPCLQTQDDGWWLAELQRLRIELRRGRCAAR